MDIGSATRIPPGFDQHRATRASLDRRGRTDRISTEMVNNSAYLWKSRLSIASTVE
jgi:hypothetical protein